MNRQKHKVAILVVDGFIGFYKDLGFASLIAKRNLLESAIFPTQQRSQRFHTSDSLLSWEICT